VPLLIFVGLLLAICFAQAAFERYEYLTQELLGDEDEGCVEFLHDDEEESAVAEHLPGDTEPADDPPPERQGDGNLEETDERVNVFRLSCFSSLRPAGLPGLRAFPIEKR